MSTLLRLIDECIDFIANYNVKAKEINILCFGDSLTRGYYGFQQHSPYSNTLKHLIQTQYENFIKINVIESGIDGEMLTVTMLQRITQIMNNSKYDIVIILGGTNDIGSKKKPNQICEILTRIYNEITIIHKSKCIAVTIPPMKKRLFWKQLYDARNNVNDFIRKHINSNTANQSIYDCYKIDYDLMYLCDLYDHIDSLTTKQRERFFDYDELHLSEYGYAQFGALLFNVMEAILDDLLSLT